jgi:hypothetical protein
MTGTPPSRFGDALAVVPRLSPLHGLFLGSHAVSEGFLTRRQLQSGLYRRVLRNVYADPSLKFDHELLCRAAALLMPPDAVLGGRSAAVWWDAPTAGVTDQVLVIVPPTSSWRGPKGVRVHKSEVAEDDVVVVDDGIRITSPTRTARDIAALERTKDAVACLDAMLHNGALTDVALRDLASAVLGQWGSRRLQKLLPLVDGRAMSPPESWVRVACHLAGLAHPVPQLEIFEKGIFLGQVDLAWPEAKLIIEYEGPHHFDELQIVKDDYRYDRMVAAGWHVIRLSSADLRDLDAVVARIKEALRTRALGA